MKKILFGLALLISFSVNAQIRVCQLPQVTSGTLNDYIIKEDSTCHGTRKIKISDFIATYSLGGGGGSTDTTSLSNRINNKIDTLYKNSTGDSFIYKINGRRHALVDSTGSSTGSVSPIESSWSTALARIGSIVAGQAYKVNNDDLNLPAGVDYILIWGLDAGAYKTIAQAKLASTAGGALGGVYECQYDVVGDKFSLILEVKALATQTGTNDPVITIVQNQVTGTTYTCGYSDVGKYVFTLINSEIPNAAFDLSIFTKVWVEPHGVIIAGGDLDNPYSFSAGYYESSTEDFRFGSQYLDLTTGMLTPQDGLLNDTPITIKLAIFN